MSHGQRLVVLCVLGPLMAWYGWNALAGERHVKQASAFVRTATSVRVTVGHPGRRLRTVEIACPDRVRIETTTSTGGRDIVVIGSEAMRTHDGKPWEPVAVPALPVVPICSGTTLHRGRPSLGEAFEALTARRVRVDDTGNEGPTASGEKCRLWIVRDKWDIGPDASDRINLCLSTQYAQRPVSIAFADGRSWFFDRWNEPMDIGLPYHGAPAAAP